MNFAVQKSSPMVQHPFGWIGKHKTAMSYGHASLYINPNVYKALKVYQEKIRPMAKPSTRAFFVNCSGKRMASNAARKSMQLFWHYCGMKEGASWAFLALKGWCHIGE